MAVFKAIGKGIGTACRKPRVLVDLWAANLIFGLAVAAPFFLLVRSDLGHSRLGERLRSFDFDWLGGFIHKYQDAAPAAAGWIAAPVLIYLGLLVFLNGGTIGRLLDPEGGSKLGEFFGDCGRYFWRFVRLFLLSLPFYAVVFLGFAALLSALIEPWLDKAITEWRVIILSNLEFVVTLLLLTIIQAVFDYARIIVVAEDDRGALHALRMSLRFLGRRFFRSWGLYLLIAAAAVAGTVLFYLAFRPLAPSGRLGFIALGIVLMQAYIIFRLWVRMLFFAAQGEFYRQAHD